MIKLVIIAAWELATFQKIGTFYWDMELLHFVNCLNLFYLSHWYYIIWTKQNIETKKWASK